MGIFKNLFSCNFSDDNTNESRFDLINKEINELKRIQDELKGDIKQLYRDGNNLKSELIRLETKIDSKFDVMTIKLDNVLMLLTNKKNSLDRVEAEILSQKGKRESLWGPNPSNPPNPNPNP